MYIGSNVLWGQETTCLDSANDRALQLMDGRYFAGTRVEAYISDGSERFKKSNEKRAALEDLAERGLDADEDEEEKQRLDEFGTWLESSHTVENTDK